MHLTEPERLFVARRRRLVNVWPTMGSILLLGIVCLGSWLFWKTPLLVNPYMVLARLNEESIPNSTLSLMAGLLPVAVLACLLLIICVILFAFVALSNEKKHLAMVLRLTSGQESPQNRKPQEA